MKVGDKFKVIDCDSYQFDNDKCEKCKNTIHTVENIDDYGDGKYEITVMNGRCFIHEDDKIEIIDLENVEEDKQLYILPFDIDPVLEEQEFYIGTKEQLQEYLKEYKEGEYQLFKVVPAGKVKKEYVYSWEEC